MVEMSIPENIYFLLKSMVAIVDMPSTPPGIKVKEKVKNEITCARQNIRFNT